jgi:HAE1 family hydrophobic/amphiphilic exporter-1
VKAGAPGFYGTLVRRPVGTLVVFLTLIVVSWIAYVRIPIQLLPSGYSEPRLWMWVANPGASAQENEELVARVVEEQLRTLPGIEQLLSWSERDVVRMRLSFAGSADMNLAKAEVRDRLERARANLPATAENPEVWSESSDTLPITFFGLTLRGDPDRRDHLMEKVVVPRLEAVQGIGKVSVWGVLEDSVRILLDEDKVTAAGVDLGDIIRRLARDNFALPMGALEDGGRELIVRSDMRFRTPEEIAEFPVVGGLRIKDLGRVARVKAVQDELSRIDGAYAYFGMATKDSQSNVVATSENFRAALEELKRDPNLAGEFSVMLFFLQGDMIRSALAQLKDTALQGGVLAVVVLLVFLRRWRLTLCVALSIPVSALLAIAWEYFTGGTFNVLTMTGITLATGMLVDNAVVVVENIARLHRAGLAPREAAAEGTREIALAVTLATLTTVVVFLPLIFMTDHAVLRILFASMGLPLSISLLASLLLAIVFTPVVVARMMGERKRTAAGVARLAARVGILPVRAVAGLVAALRWSAHLGLRALHRANRAALLVLAPLRWPLAAASLAGAGLVLARALRERPASAVLEPFGIAAPTPAGIAFGAALPALFVLAMAAFALGRWRRPSRPPARPAAFLPAGDSLVDMTIELNHRLLAWTLGHRLAATGATLLVLGSIAVPLSMMEVTAFGEDSSGDQIDFRVGLEGSFTLAEAEDELRVYEEFLESKRADYGFAHWSNRFDEDSGHFGLHFEQQKTGAEFEVLEKRLKDEIPRVSGHRLRFYGENQSDGRTTSVARFTLLGPDSEVLERLGVRAASLLERVPGLSQVSTPLESAPDQIEVAIDRDAAHELGVTSATVENTISYVLGGFPLPRFQEEGREVPLRIEFDEAEVAGLPTLADLSVFGEQGAVPLSSLAGLSFSKGARSIFRRNGKTSFTLEAKVDDPLQVLTVTEAGLRALEELDLPRGYSIDRSDSALRQQQEEFGELRKAFALSVVLVFLLMGILFESVMLPFSVLFTIPFAVLGSLWTLFLTGTAMDSMGWIGLIILAGVVVNNGIVLIDRIHALRPSVPDRTEAVLEGARQRVRPVLMTALTTIVGLLPMIMAEPPRDGFDYRALAAIVAGGLGASTVFTLWVVPLAYTVIDDFSTVMRARFLWWFRRPGAAGRRAEAPATRT